MVKFQKFYVTDGVTKARVHYSLDNRCDGRQCVTIYARDYGHALGQIIGDSYTNDTDSQTDYFDKGRVVLFADHPLYQAARARAEGPKWAGRTQEQALAEFAEYGPGGKDGTHDGVSAMTTTTHTPRTVSSEHPVNGLLRDVSALTARVAELEAALRDTLKALSVNSRAIPGKNIANNQALRVKAAQAARTALAKVQA